VGEAVWDVRYDSSLLLRARSRCEGSLAGIGAVLLGAGLRNGLRSWGWAECLVRT